MEKHWVKQALFFLEKSRYPVPQELNDLDWKVALSDQKDKLARHLIAFANHSGGGYLAYGINNTDANTVLLTQSDIEKIMNQLTNLARDAVEPPLVLDHSVELVDGFNILLVRIAESSSKPVHLRGKSIEEAWVRSGGTTRRADRKEIGMMMLNSRIPTWEEIRISEMLSAEAVDNMLDLKEILRLSNKRLPDSLADRMSWLEEQKMVVPDGNGYYITNLGAIAAARNLEDFPAVKRKRIRVIRYEGKGRASTTFEEAQGSKGYAIGFEGLIGYLDEKLPSSEVIHQSLRQRVCMYPEIILREIVANMLIHQDFSITGAGPIIDIFSDRVEFTSPGGLLPSKSVDRLIGTTPQSRNEVLASVFRQYGICEERGTGFEKAVTAVELYGLPPLSFQLLENAFRVILFSPRPFADMTTEERIEAAYQHAVLRYITNQPMTNTTLRERFKLNDKARTQISNLIRDAIDAKRIKRKDDSPSSSTKFVEYLPYWG